MNIVISGGSSGFGRAMSKEFINRGDNVLFFSKTSKSLAYALKDIKSPNIHGEVLNITNRNHLQNMNKIIQKKFPNKIDAFINNAAYSGGYNMFKDIDEESIINIINTNLIGSIICTKNILELNPGHIFFLAGAGSNGTSTKAYSIYGASKAGITQFAKTMSEEIENTNFHVISPGMMTTPLLLDNTKDKNLDMVFNIFCETPENVAHIIVPQIKNVIKNNNKHKHIKYLTVPKMIARLATAHQRIHRFI